MKRPGTYVAGWVPESLTTSWEDAEALAATWVSAHLAARGGRLLVLAETRSNLDCASPGPLARLIARSDIVTRRSRGRIHQNRHSAVLALYAGVHVMELAISAASRGAGLCVIGGSHSEVAGWAQDVAAVNLRTGRATPDARSEQLRRDLDRLQFVGNNGWGDEYGRRDAIRILKAIKARDELEEGVVLGTMLARGAHGNAVETLRKLIATRV